jgi:hypothetical protein
MGCGADPDESYEYEAYSVLDISTGAVIVSGGRDVLRCVTDAPLAHHNGQEHAGAGVGAHILRSECYR